MPIAVKESEEIDKNLIENFSDFLGELSGIQSSTIEHILNLFIAVVIIFIALRLSEYVILKLIQKTSNNTKLAEAKLNTITRMLDGLFKFLTFLLIMIQILIAFGVDKTQILAITSAFSVAIGLAAQNVVKDLINGVMIVVEDQYKLGDFIQINGFKGEVEKLTMRVTQLRDVDGSLHIIPNSSIVEVTTMSKEYVKAIILIGVEYSTDTARVIKKLQELMDEAYKEMPEQMLSVPVVQGISAFKDSCIEIKIICDTAIGERVAVEYALRLKIKEMFDREGIVIPFPQRDVNIVSSKWY